MLLAVESLVAQSNTGRSQLLANYYQYWERRLYNAICKMVIRSMASLQLLLNMVSPKDLSATAPVEERRLVIKVKATMNNADIVVTPLLTDIYRFLSKAVKHQVESATAFVRWMHSTCIFCEPVIRPGGDDEEPVIMSYYSDVSQNAVIIKMMLQLNQNVHRSFKTFESYLSSWKRYDAEYDLWNAKKRARLAQGNFSTKSIEYFDGKLTQFQTLALNVGNQTTEKTVDFLHIDCFPCAVAIRSQAELCGLDYAKILHKLSKGQLQDIKDVIIGLQVNLTPHVFDPLFLLPISLRRHTLHAQADVERPPVDLESLKFVLSKITEVASVSMAMELRIVDVVEKYRTMRAFGVPLDDEEAALVDSIADEWMVSVFFSAFRMITAYA